MQTTGGINENGNSHLSPSLSAIHHILLQQSIGIIIGIVRSTTVTTTSTFNVAM